MAGECVWGGGTTITISNHHVQRAQPHARSQWDQCIIHHNQQQEQELTSNGNMRNSMVTWAMCWTRTGLDSYLDLVIAGQQQQQQVFSVPYGDAPQREWHHQKCVRNPKTQSWKTGKSSECQTRFEGMGVDVDVEELSAGQKLRIAESAQHQRRGELLSSPPAWNLSQSFALFFFSLFSFLPLLCVGSRCVVRF